MRISTSMSEAMVSWGKMADFSPWVESDLLPQVKELKYLGIKSDSKMQQLR